MGRGEVFSQTESVAFFIGSINFQDAKMLLVNRAEQLAHSAKMSHFTTFAYEARFSSQNKDFWRENSNIRCIIFDMKSTNKRILGIF